MKRFLTPAACAAAILLSGVSVDAILAPVAAQSDDQIGFDSFHDQLAAYGDWVYSDRWGEVWIPTNVPDDFQPYGTNGFWADTDEYGWTWVSNYEWGDIPFHYGRWVNDPDDGWLWIPGYVWSPAWVIWRSNGQYTGWMPMPPDRDFLEGGGPSLGVSVDYGNTGDYYGYSQWYGPGYDESRFASNWVFVGTGHLADRDFSRYRAPSAQYATIIHDTTNATHYSVVNNFIVNRSIDPNVVQRASGHPVPVVHAAEVMKKPQFVTHADQGREVQARMLQQMPRGTGIANSAPKPPPHVVQSLSTKVAPRSGHPTAHLYTRDTVTSAPLPVKPGGSPPHATAPTAPPKEFGPRSATPQAASPTGERPMERERPTSTGPAIVPETAAPASTRHHENEASPTPATPETTRHRENEIVAPTRPVAPTAPATGTPETTHHRENEMVAPTKPVAPTTPAAPETMRHHGNEVLPENQTAAPATPPVRERAVRPVAPPPPAAPTAPPPPPAPTKPVERVMPKAVPPPPPPDKPEKKVKPDDDKPQ